jgi:hypothetical protein
VTHIREKIGFGAIKLGERFGALALLLVGAGIGDGDRDLIGENAIKIAR